MEDINTFKRLVNKAAMLTIFERYAMHYNRDKETAIIKRNIGAVITEARKALLNNDLTSEEFFMVLYKLGC